MKQIFPIYIFLLFSFFCISSRAIAETYPEVLFENSVLPHNYSNSTVSYEGDSWIKNLKKRLPVSDSIYFTPNNALLVNYISAQKGHWEASISYPEVYYAPKNSVLIFKLYIQSATTVNELPAIQLLQADSALSEKVFIKDFLSSIQENTWLSVEIPLRRVRGFNDEVGVSQIRFVQHSQDGKEHQLYLDQIEILPQKTPQTKLTGAAVLYSVTPFEQHVDISWRLPLTSSIRYIKIYRSEDNVDFEPVGIRPIFASKYTDIVPEIGKAYYYKIAWVDYQYRESPFSTVKEIKTKLLSDEELLNMVHNANIQYFIDGVEFNSGMQQLRMSGKDAIVSTKLTGVGLMALISGTQQKLLSREVLIGRVQKIIDFLGRSESFHGAFPALLDGRTGKGIFVDPANRVVDLKATSYLIQGLLVAKEYLNHENAVEASIRNKIDKIWNSVEWKEFVKPGSPFLFTYWSVDNGFNEATPLVGRDALSTYLIATSSPSYNIELESYRQALNLSYKPDTSVLQDIEEISYAGVDSTGEARISIITSPERIMEVTSKSDDKTSYYGVPFHIGDSDGSLNRFLAALLVFNSKDKHDEYANYYKELQNLILIQYRRSLEENNLPASLSKSLIVSSKGWVDPSANVASYPFQTDFALSNLVAVYRNYPALFWSEYGFRAINLETNTVRSDFEGMNHGVAAVMIENGKSGLIWDLFSKNKDVEQVINALFEKD